MDANELKDAAGKLSGLLRRTRQTQWARELDDILDGPASDTQKMGEILQVLRRLNGTSLPQVLGLTESLPKLITDIETFFRPKR